MKPLLSFFNLEFFCFVLRPWNEGNCWRRPNPNTDFWPSSPRTKDHWKQLLWTNEWMNEWINEWMNEWNVDKDDWKPPKWPVHVQHGFNVCVTARLNWPTDWRYLLWMSEDVSKIKEIGIPCPCHPRRRVRQYLYKFSLEKETIPVMALSPWGKKS